MKKLLSGILSNIERFCRNGAAGKMKIIFHGLNFADKLNKQMPKNENYMFSPLSVKMALALAANGADGTTKSEILNALEIENIEDFNSFSEKLIKRYSKTDILKINIANSIWINEDKTAQNFSGDFKKTAENCYNADARIVNNKNAAVKINSWTEDKTNKKITSIVRDNDDFWAELINVIYFKGIWQDEFDESKTKPDKFKNEDNTKTQTDFMNRTDWIDYAKTKSAKIINLPYKTDEFNGIGRYIAKELSAYFDVSMYLIAAKKDINISAELEKAIDNDMFKSRYIKLSVPKFKIEYSEILNGMLENIGIKRAFDGSEAQFEKMFDSGNVHITDIIHKTYISVDEKGTEAAAATVIGGVGAMLPPKPRNIKFNKPFYFVIRDNLNGEILFMGRFAYAK